MKLLLTLLAIPCIAVAGERAYTVREIDDLRRAVTERFLWGNANGPVTTEGVWVQSSVYKEETKAKVVEEQVRTYMLAGITGEDLRKADKRP